MEMIEYIEIGLVIIMIGGLIGAFINRYQSKKGISARAIQFTGVILLLPLIGILSLESKL